MTSLQKLGCAASRADVEARIVRHFGDVFERDVIDAPSLTAATREA